MWGNGLFNTSKPPLLGGILFPCESTTSAITPGNAFPAFVGLAGKCGNVPRHGPPVSVCHQLSITKPHSPLPQITRYAHSRASGFKGSPATEKRRILRKSYFWGN